MTHLNLPHVNENLIKFETGIPYDPYKQLLLILPISSLHLLPEPLRKVVADENAPLHKYYPTEFDLDPFGAVFESEYIAKIPFVDEGLLDKEYKKGITEALALLNPDEALRNTKGHNLVFEWSDQAPESVVESSLPMYFDNFKVKVKTSKFELEDLKFDPKKILDALPQGSTSYHSSFPSLHFIQSKKPEMKSFEKKFVTFYKCCFKIHETLGVHNEKDYQKLLEQPLYCMYPFLIPCVVLAIVTPERLITNLPYYELPFPYSKAEHKNYYKDLSANIHDLYFTEAGVLFEHMNPVFAVVSCESEARKDSLGNIYCPSPLIDVIPLDLLMPTSFNSFYRGNLDYSRKDLTKEFPKFSDVVINVGPQIGALAEVVGYSRKPTEFDQVEVKIKRAVPNLSNDTRKIAMDFDSQRNYCSVQTVSKQLGVEVPVILQVLDSIVIKTEASEEEKSIYPERFDLGLNLIQRKNHTIVPELVICHELDQNKRSRAFPQFQVSVEGVELLREYYRQHPAVFSAIKRKIDTRDPSILTAEYIFYNVRDPNLELLKVYIWLMKQDTSNLILANKASKVIPREGILEIERVLGKQDYNNEQAGQIVGKVAPFNPNFLIQKQPDSWIPPLFFKKPPWHIIGDRIVNLKINGCNFAPFGATGTVVGILGNKPENGVLEVKIEIMFDRPFLGGTNLGGRCNWGRGAIVDFDDIYNLNSWGKCVKPRDRRQDYYYAGWDGMITKSYVPTFQTSESEGEDTSGTESKNPDQKNFSVRTRPEGLIPKHSGQKGQSQQQNQGPVENQWTVKQSLPKPTSTSAQIQVQQRSQGQGQVQVQAQSQDHKQLLEQLSKFPGLGQTQQQGQGQVQDQNQIFQQLQQLQGQTVVAQHQTQLTQAQILDQLKQLQGVPVQTQQPPVLDQNQLLQQLQQIQGISIQNQGQGQQQPQAQHRPPNTSSTPNQPGYQAPTQAKPTVLPKTLGLKQPTGAHVEKLNPHSTTFVSKVEPTKPEQNQPGAQGSFNFNTFLSSNLAKNATIPPTNVSESSLKEAIGFTSTGADHHRHKLNKQSQTFTVKQRPQESQQNPAPQTINVGAPTAQDQNALLSNFIANLNQAPSTTTSTQSQNQNALLSNFISNLNQAPSATTTTQSQDANPLASFIANAPHLVSNLSQGGAAPTATLNTQDQGASILTNLLASAPGLATLNQGEPLNVPSVNVNELEQNKAETIPEVSNLEGNAAQQPTLSASEESNNAVNVQGVNVPIDNTLQDPLLPKETTDSNKEANVEGNLTQESQLSKDTEEENKDRS